MSSGRPSPVSKVASSWVGKTKQTGQQRWFSKLKAGKRRAFPYTLEGRISRLGGLRCPIDEAFGDLSQSGISLLFFSQGLLQKPGRIA